MLLNEKEIKSGKVRWDTCKMLTLLSECRKAGLEEVDKQMAKLVAAGPRYEVVDGVGKSYGTMLDVCGFAHLHIAAKGKFYLLAKKMSNENRQMRFHCDKEYGGGAWFSVYDISHRQEMSVNVAAMRGVQTVLAKYGIESTIRSRID